MKKKTEDGPIPGSFEELSERIRAAVKSYLPSITSFDPEDDWCYIVATFPASVIIEVVHYGDDVRIQTFWRINYSQDDEGSISFEGGTQMEPTFRPIANQDAAQSAFFFWWAPSAGLRIESLRDHALQNGFTVETLEMTGFELEEAKAWATNHSLSGDFAMIDGDVVSLHQSNYRSRRDSFEVILSEGVKAILAPGKDTEKVEEGRKTEAALLEATLTEASRNPKITTRLEENGTFSIETRALLLESRASAIQKFRQGIPVEGKAPLMVAGIETANKRLYTVEAVQHLYAEMETILEAGDPDRTTIHAGPWPTGAMYPTHDQALNDGGNVLTDAAARFTGLYVEGGKDISDLEDGDVVGIYFSMLSTGAGRDTTAVLLETDWISGLSLRGFSEGDVKDEGSETVRVNRLQAQAFGADFVKNHAAPFPDPEGAVPIIEDVIDEDGKEQEPMKLEELKEKHPDLYKQIVAEGKSEGEGERAELRGQLLESGKERAASNVLAAFTPKIEAMEELDEDGQKALTEEFTPAVHGAVAAAHAERPELPLDGQSFRDLVVGKVEGIFESKKTSYNLIASRAAEIAFKRAGIDPATVVPRTPDGIGGGDNAPRIESAPYINTLPYDALCIEEDNERVGLPRGRKHPDGRFLAPRVTDVLHSMASDNIPVYVQDDDSGNPIHILDKYRPGLRQTIEEISKVYWTKPFLDVGPGSVNDQMLVEGQYSDVYKKFRSAVTERRKVSHMEANEMTSTNTLPTLSPDVRQGALEKLFAQMVATSIATIVPCRSDSYRIDYEEARREAVHIFGVLTQGSGFAATGDEGALTVPDHRVYLKVTTLTAGVATITVTYTNENSVSKTVTVSIPDATAVDTLVPVYLEVGDKCLDVTTGTETGWTAGVVQIIAFEAPTHSSQIAVPDKARTWLATRTGTVGDKALAAELAWSMIEDANMSLAMHGSGRYDTAARVVRNLSNEIADHEDRDWFRLLNSSSDFESTNTIAFDVTTIPAGMTAAEHKATLLEQIYDLQAMLLQKSFLPPDWMIVNYGDRSKLLWVTRDIIRPNTSRAEAFFRNQDWGQMAGMDSRVAFHQNHQRILAGANQTAFYPIYVPLQLRGPFPAIGGATTDTYMARNRTAKVTVRPESRGYIEITE